MTIVLYCISTDNDLIQYKIYINLYIEDIFESYRIFARTKRLIIVVGKHPISHRTKNIRSLVKPSVLYKFQYANRPEKRLGFIAMHILYPCQKLGSSKEVQNRKKTQPFFRLGSRLFQSIILTLDWSGASCVLVTLLRAEHFSSS